MASRVLLDVGSGLAGILVIVGLFLRGWLRPAPARLGHALVLLVLLLVVASAITAIQADPRPVNDVWDMLQATSQGLVHGRDMYLQHWPAPPGEDSRYYTYLPGTAVILLPFRVLFGDVRYGYVAALALASVLVSRLEASRAAIAAACLLLLAPVTIGAVEQAWNEPLILGAVVAMIYLVTRGRPNWAVVCLGAALVTKQYAWIVVPFAAYWKPFGWRRTAVACLGAAVFMLPWAVADWHAFSEGSIVSLIQTSGATGAHGSTALFLHYFTLSIAAITTRHGHEVPAVLTVAVTALKTFP